MKFTSAIALAAISGASAFVAPQGPAASTTQLSMSDVRTSVRCVNCPAVAEGCTQISDHTL